MAREHLLFLLSRRILTSLIFHTEWSIETALKGENVEAVVIGRSKITQRGQVTLPKELREKFELKAGSTLYFLEVDGSIILRLGPLVLTE